jgi:hypothetical protein
MMNKLEGSGDQANTCMLTCMGSMGCGVRMPNGGPYLSDADQAKIRDWIAQGAN